MRTLQEQKARLSVVIPTVDAAAELPATLAALNGAALIGEMADLMGSLATRFAMEFEIRAPAPVVAAAGGAATNVAFTLADGDRAPGDLLESAAIGAAGEAAALGRRGARAEESEEALLRAGPVATEPVEQTWRAALKPAQAAKQATFDARARWFAKPENYGEIDEPLTGLIARAIDSQTPGAVRLVNQRIVDPEAQDVRELTDLDIVTDEVVIQVKSGETHGLSLQIRKSRSVTGKTVVGYAPAMKDNDFRRYQQEGYTVFRSLPELLGFLRGRLK